MGGTKGRRSLDKVNGFATSIGSDTRLQGTLGGKGHCIVQGQVEGDCDFEGTLVIAETGFWRGELYATNIIIAGKVEGTAVAREKMEIVSTARIKGRLQSPVIAIAEGAVHDGEIHTAQASDVRRFMEQRGSK
jgi:cytoskeletal protein CcmA (bactofilin family)